MEGWAYLIMRGKSFWKSHVFLRAIAWIEAMREIRCKFSFNYGNRLVLGNIATRKDDAVPSHDQTWRLIGRSFGLFCVCSLFTTSKSTFVLAWMSQALRIRETFINTTLLQVCDRLVLVSDDLPRTCNIDKFDHFMNFKFLCPKMRHASDLLKSYLSYCNYVLICI